MKPGLIETFLWAGRSPFLTMSMRRLRRSARKLGIPLPGDRIRNAVRRIRDLPPRPHRIRILLTPGGEIRLETKRMTAEWLTAQDPPKCRLAAMPAPRNYPGQWPGLKTTDRRGLERAYRQATRINADDALLLLPGGRLSETSRGNLFWTKNGVVFTPPLQTGCLAGLARAWVLDACWRAGIPASERQGGLENLKRANGVFRTNAVIGVEWVSEIIGALNVKWSDPPPPAAALHRQLQKLFLTPEASGTSGPP